MSDNGHAILCSKCKKPGTAEKSECASCGGRVVRLCGSCGFTNAAAKKYCDACGENFSKALPPKPAPKPPPPAPKAEAKAPPPRPEPKPAPRPEQKAPPPPPPKPEPKPEPPPVRLPELAVPAAEKAEPPPPQKKEEPKPAPLDLKPAEPPKPAKDSRDEALGRFIPKTVMSRLPAADAVKAERDDEPVPDVRPAEKPKEPPHKAPDGPQPPIKKERVKMRLEGDPTPLPVKLPKEPPKPEARPEPKPHPKPEPVASKEPEAAKKDPAPAPKKGLDPRLVKGYELPEKAPPPDSHPPKRVEGPSQTFIQRRPKAVFSTAMALLLLAIGFVVYALKVKQKKSPAETMVKTAGDYLFALKQKDWAKAYAMLTRASQKAASPESFRALQDETAWTFDDIRVQVVADGWALVRYKLIVSGQAFEEDWLVLQLEEGQWRRAYWWTLMPDMEAALSRADHAAAARLAKEAQLIDPIDPLPPAYYCEAAYLAGDPNAAREACRKALDMAQSLPSRLGPEGLFRLNHILADIDRRILRKPSEAARAYGILLAYPKLEEAQRCDLLLARAEAALELAQAAQALEDFRSARTSCRVEADQAYAARGTSILAGEAGAEAVAAVSAHRMPGDDQTLTEWRAKTRLDLSQRLKTRPQDLPEERWTAAHKEGPVYTVILMSGPSELLSAEVDLFSRKIKVDIHVQ